MQKFGDKRLHTVYLAALGGGDVEDSSAFVLDVQGDAFIFKVGIVAFGFYAKAEIALAVIAKVVRLVVVDAVAVFIHDIVLVDDVHKVRKVAGWEGDKVIADGLFLTRVVHIAPQKQRFAVYRIFLRDVYIAVTHPYAYAV